MADKNLPKDRTPKGAAYCNTRGTSCMYDENDVCINCGRPKGWRVHKLHRGPVYQSCPGSKDINI